MERNETGARFVPSRWREHKARSSWKPVSASIVTWYLIHNVGDDISLHAQWDEHEAPNPVYSEAVLNPDRIDHVVAALISAGILKDEGLRFRDDEDPQVYVRNLRNIWGINA